jgi:hypothetical protein
MPTLANDLDAGRLANRRIDEFIGLCRALAAKQTLTTEDVQTLEVWLEKNRPIADLELIEEVADAVDEASFDIAEIPALLEILRSFVGGSDVGNALPTSLPLTVPAPTIEFVGKRFCFTGEFNFGSRNDCMKAVEARGAIAVDVMTASTDVLVVGSKMAPTWKHSSYGNKISQAVAWSGKGYSIAIVSEEHWRDQLNRPSPNGPHSPSAGPSPPQGPSGRPSPGTGGAPPQPGGSPGPSASPQPAAAQSAKPADVPTSTSTDTSRNDAVGSSLFWRSPVPHRAGTKARQKALTKFTRVYTDFSEGKISAQERDDLLDKLVPKSAAKVAAPNDIGAGVQAIIDNLPPGGAWSAPPRKGTQIGQVEFPAPIDIVPLAEGAGRAVGRLRRLPWYVLPLAIFVLSFWYVSAQLSHSAPKAQAVAVEATKR